MNARIVGRFVAAMGLAFGAVGSVSAALQSTAVSRRAPLPAGHNRRYDFQRRAMSGSRPQRVPGELQCILRTDRNDRGDHPAGD